MHYKLILDGAYLAFVQHASLRKFLGRSQIGEIGEYVSGLTGLLIQLLLLS